MRSRGSSGSCRWFVRRHPLQELVVDAFVPNDTYIIGGSGLGTGVDDLEDDSESHEDRHFVRNSVVVCTGANASGKVQSYHRCRVITS